MRIQIQRRLGRADCTLFWYDEGIEAGGALPQEINYALEQTVPLITVHMEVTDLPSGLLMTE
jgi:hypothetical protein